MDKRLLKQWILDIPTIKLMIDNYAVDIYKKNKIRALAVYEKEDLKNARYGKLKFIHFIEEEKWTTYKEEKWYPGSLNLLTFGIYCLENKIYKNKKIVKYINKKEKEIIDKKRNDKYTKEINTFKEFNKQVPEVPKNFYKFINRKVMNGYALYNNKNHQAYCTTCQNKFNIKKLKREEKITCPFCRKHLQALPIGHYSYYQEKYSCLIQKTKKNNLVLRYFLCIKTSSSSMSKENSCIAEVKRVFFNIETHETEIYIKETYKGSNYHGFIPKKYEKGTQNYWQQKDYWVQRGVLYTGNLKEIQEVPLKYIYNSKCTKSTIDFLQNNIQQSIKNLLQYPFIETYIKENRIDILEALGKCELIVPETNEPSKALKISRNLLKNLPKKIDDTYLLAKLQLINNSINALGETEIKYLNNYKLCNYEALKNVYEIINEKFDKVSRYLEKNDSTMSDYYDYLKNLNELHITINKKSAFPDNFWKAHDEVVVEYAKEKAKLKDIQNKEKEIKYKEIKEKSIYQPLIINDLLIRLPESLEEIKIEGILQNNCVNSYVNRILDKQTNVLFGRKVSRPDIPYITIEIKDNRVLQARYKGNINCTAEDTKTIESYIASIKTPDKKNQAA